MKKLIIIFLLIGGTLFGQTSPTTVTGVAYKANLRSVMMGILPFYWWTTVRNGSWPSATALRNDDSYTLGVEVTAGNLSIYRSEMIFDISAMPNNIDLDSVVMKVYGVIDSGTEIAIYPANQASCVVFDNDWPLITRETNAVPSGLLVGNGTYKYHSVNLGKTLPPSMVYTGRYACYSFCEYDHDFLNSFFVGTSAAILYANDATYKPELKIYWHTSASSSSKKTKIIFIQ